MTDRILVAYDFTAKRLESAVFGSGHRNISEVPVYCMSTLDTDGLVNGRDMVADGVKQDLLTVTLATDLDTMRNKVNLITVTAPADLDAIQARVNALDASVVLMGLHDASGFLFPASTIAGESWIISVGGMIDGVTFDVDDRVVALVDGASNSSYADWHKLDYTDQVLSVGGETGAVTITESMISDLQSYLLATDIDTLSKLNAIVGESLLTESVLDTYTHDSVKFNAVSDPAYAAGLIWYSSAGGGGWRGYVGEADITANFMEEQWVTVRNDTGVTIADGTPVHIVGWASGIAQVEPTIADGFRVVGLATHSIEDGTIGKVTRAGRLTGPDYSMFGVGDTIFVSPLVAGDVTNIPPLWPMTAIELGVIADNSATGSVNIDIEHHGNKNLIIKSYNFSSRDVGTGANYLGGFYDWEATDMNLTQASPSQVVGDANVGHGAHVGIVFGAASTDGTVITLTATGTSFDTSTGVSTPADSEVLYTGAVGGLTLNDYVETTKHWVGTVTLTLTSDGVNFTLDANYGLSKYEDVSNVDTTIRAFDIAGLCNTTDNSYDVELIHHENTSWVYAASGFLPGGTIVASYATDYGVNSKILGGVEFAWKRIDLLEPILAVGGEEGVLIRVTTTTNNAVSYMTCHLTAASS